LANAALKLLGSELSMFIDRKDVRLATPYDGMTKDQDDRAVQGGGRDDEND
jgi:hypothetical protein